MKGFSSVNAAVCSFFLSDLGIEAEADADADADAFAAMELRLRQAIRGPPIFGLRSKESDCFEGNGSGGGIISSVDESALAFVWAISLEMRWRSSVAARDSEDFLSKKTRTLLTRSSISR